MSILGNYGKIYIVTKGRGNTCKPSNHKSFVYFYIRQKIVQVHFEIPKQKIKTKIDFCCGICYSKHRNYKLMDCYCTAGKTSFYKQGVSGL